MFGLALFDKLLAFAVADRTIALMSTAVAYPHIRKPGNEPATLDRIPRLRVSQIVADYLAHGWSPEEMCRQHPDLRLSEAHSAMAYYFDHQDEIDHELQDEVLQSDRDRKATATPNLLIRLRAEGRL
jgi:Protein of unknown function (DUF433)